MSEDRRRILDLLAQGKITTDEAEKLLNAIAASPAATMTSVAAAPRRIKYLRVLIDGHGGEDTAKVNIRVPVALLRAGMKFASFIPQDVRGKVDDAMQQKGIAFSLNDIKPETIDELVDSLGELTVDVDADDATVKIFCE